MLALPSIISTDLSNITVESITASKKLALWGYKNIPASYGIEYTPADTAEIEFVKDTKIVVYS